MGVPFVREHLVTPGIRKAPPDTLYRKGNSANKWGINNRAVTARSRLDNMKVPILALIAIQGAKCTKVVGGPARRNQVLSISL